MPSHLTTLATVLAALALQGCVVGTVASTAVSATGKVAGATVGAAGDVAKGAGHAVVGGGGKKDER